jgi:hypothetical protein
MRYSFRGKSSQSTLIKSYPEGFRGSPRNLT